MIASLALVATIALGLASADAKPSAAPGEINGYAIIWGGGASPADAQAALSTWQEAAKGIGGFFDFPSGYPQIVESAKVPGLKPGFHVVVLGMCPFDDALVPLLLAKKKNPGAYGRKTSAANAAQCPKLRSEFRVKSRHTVEVDGVTLRAAVVTKDGTKGAAAPDCTTAHAACAAGGPTCPCSKDRGEECREKTFTWDAVAKKSVPQSYSCETPPTELDAALLLELRDATDNSLDARIVSSDDLDGFDCALNASSLKDGVELSSKCYQAFCTTPSEVEATRSYKVSKKRIKERVESTETTQGVCD